jgi:photosystem II stability/assembly factor-like uncharacterized protein
VTHWRLLAATGTARGAWLGIGICLVVGVAVGCNAYKDGGGGGGVEAGIDAGPTVADVSRHLGLTPDIVAQFNQTGLSNQTLLARPKSEIQEATWELGHPDQPGSAAAFQSRSEHGRTVPIAPDALANAVAALQPRTKTALKMVALMPSGPQPEASALMPPELPPDAELFRSKWFGFPSGSIGGRTRSIAVHPSDPRTIFIASPAGGVWRTRDAGQTWLPVDDFMANLATSTVIFDPANPANMYAGTGEGFYNLDAIRGAGVFASHDGGASWSQLTKTATPDFYFVNRLAMNGAGVLLAATGRKDQNSPRGGIQRSADGGATWQQATGLPNVTMFDVKFAPDRPDSAVAAGEGVVAYSSDDGASWAPSAGLTLPGRARTELAFARADSRIVYASIDVNGGIIAKSTDRGQHFSVVATRGATNYLGLQGWYSNTIWAGDPRNANVLIVGGLDMWLSSDGGLSMRPLTAWSSDNAIHADQHAIVSAINYGSGSETIFVGNDGGVYRIDNLNALHPGSALGSTSLNHNFNATQFYSVSLTPSGNIVGGTQDNGNLRYTMGNGWRTTVGGDGGQVLVDGKNKRIYSEYIYGDLQRGNDDGAQPDEISGHYWTGREWTWKDPPYLIEDTKTEFANRDGNHMQFIAPLGMDPEVPTTLYVGGASLWRTRDSDSPVTATAGPHWRAIAQPSWSIITAMAVSTRSPNVLWACHYDGSIMGTQNIRSDQPDWAPVDPDGMLPKNRPCESLLFDPRNDGVAYVTFWSFDTSNIWRTTNFGKTWSDIHGNLPRAPVHTVSLHPTHAGFIYVGTEVGVFGSEHLGPKWSATNEGPTNCSVYALAWRGTSLFAASHGRGVFSIALP